MDILKAPHAMTTRDTNFIEKYLQWQNFVTEKKRLDVEIKKQNYFLIFIEV